MHPNVFLRAFWRTELLPQVFVAMDFNDIRKKRFEEVFKPAIESIELDGVKLAAYRVDLSKSGDSILTDIMEGIAHSQLILADVSIVGSDALTGKAFRNGNVMYEVGVALACRQPSEVLLVRDDSGEKFLFDVSTIPHMHVDFSDSKLAKEAVRSELKARLSEQKYVNDARVELAMRGLSEQEVRLLRDYFADLRNDKAWGADVGGTVLSSYEFGIARLIDKQLIKMAAFFPKGHPAYQPTPFGRVVANLLKQKASRS
jgi:hypothetical protein